MLFPSAGINDNCIGVDVERTNFTDGLFVLLQVLFPVLSPCPFKLRQLIYIKNIFEKIENLNKMQLYLKSFLFITGYGIAKTLSSSL